jgi:hypothetical protein
VLCVVLLLVLAQVQVSRESRREPEVRASDAPARASDARSLVSLPGPVPETLRLIIVIVAVRIEVI